MAMMPRKDKLPVNRTGNITFTVKDLLHIPLLREARILSGEKDMLRAVTRVNVIETMESLSWIKPGEFAMANGYPLGEDPGRWIEFVADLARRGAAAIGIRKGAVNGELSRELIAEAEKRELPLLELPEDCAMSEVAGMVMERVLALESSLLADLQNRIQIMSRLLLEGGGIFAFLDTLEEIAGNPLAIVRENDKPWLSASLRNSDSPDNWPLMQSLTFRQVGRSGGGGFAHLQSSFRAYLSAVPTRKTKQAYMVLIERNREIQPIDAICADRLASLAGFEIENADAVREVEGKYLDRFIQDWLSGKIVSDADWKQRSDVCGFAIPEHTPMCAVLVGGRTTDSAEMLKELAGRWRSEKGLTDGLLAAQIGDDLAIVLPIQGEWSSGPERDEAASRLICKLLVELRSHLGEREIKLYAGRVAGHAVGVQGSWAQAKRARQVAEVCGLPGEVVFYDRLGVYSLLYMIPPGEEREQFLNRYAIPLQLADRKGGGRLVETLEMFFRCNGNIKLTSEKLFAHYNTIVYRLDKVKSILGVSLDDPEDRLQLHLALKLVRITPGSPG